MAKRLSADALAYFREQGAKGGKIGGKRVAEMMTPAERKARAIKASRAAALVRTAKRKAALEALDAQLTDLERKRRAAALARTKKKHAKKATG